MSRVRRSTAAHNGPAGSRGHAIACIALVLLPTAGFPARGVAQEGRVHLDTGTVDLKPAPRRIRAEYFGIHIHRAVAGPDGAKASWPRIGAGSWRLWDAYVSWADLQPEANDWRFERLDSLVALAERHGVAVYLTLGRTPHWASSRPTERSAYGPGEQAPPAELASWTRYVDTVSKRYRGRIAAYEIWNEPNMPGFFSGSVADLVALAGAAYPTIKRADPHAIVVSPSPADGIRGVEWLSTYLASGGGAFTDVLGLHPYATNDRPEAILDLLLAAAQLAANTRGGIPFWVTELGWFIQNSDSSVVRGRTSGALNATIISDTIGAAYITRALLLARCAGADRVMWYAWDNRRMGLTESDLTTPKVVARGYRSAVHWLRGNTVRRCQRDASGRWRVSITTPHGSSITVGWHDTPNAPGTFEGAVISAIGNVRGKARHTRLVTAGMPFVLAPRRR